MQVAFIHEIGANFRTIAIGKEHVIRQNYRRPRLAILFETLIDVLEEIELFVAGDDIQIIAGRAFAAFFRAKGRIKSTTS